MKKQLLVSAIASISLLFPFSVVASVPNNPPFQIAQYIWQEFSSLEGGFKVLMPGAPRQSQQTLNIKGSTIQTKAFLVERRQESVTYGVGYVDFQINPNQPFDINTAFNSGQYQIMIDKNERYRSEQNVRLGVYPGRETKIITSTGELVKIRSYLVKRRLYILIVQTSREKDLTKSISGFFNSFKLLDN